MGTKPVGMDGALSMLNLSLMGTHHRAIDDVRNIARIVAEIVRRGWRPEAAA